MTETDISKVLIEGEYATIMGVKYKRVEEPKPQTLYDALRKLDKPMCTDDVLNAVEKWLPKEQSAAGSQNVYVECSVEGFNDCLKQIKGKLR